MKKESTKLSAILTAAGRRIAEPQLKADLPQLLDYLRACDRFTRHRVCRKFALQIVLGGYIGTLFADPPVMVAVLGAVAIYFLFKFEREVVQAAELDDIALNHPPPTWAGPVLQEAARATKQKT